MRAPRGGHEIMTRALCRSYRATDRNHWDINVIGALGASQQEQVFSTASVGPMLALTWRAGSGVWRLTWTPARLDLVFDARGYSEIVEQDVPTIEQTVHRVARNLGAIRGELGFSINRVALVVTGTAASSADLRPTEIVARSFFNAEIQASCEAGQVLDISGRVNNTVLWKPTADSSIALNCIDSGAANWGLRDGRDDTSLSCYLDINTSPKDAIDLSAEEIVAFFAYATNWATGRLNRLVKAR
jgi:hypothetical protein